jgi:type II secretory pathway pseudopilin PulG
MNPKFFIFPKITHISCRTGIGNKGFTIAEFLVAFAVLSILMAAMISLFIILIQSYTTQNVAAGVQQVVRTGIDIMAQNIRMAGFNPMKLNEVGIKSDYSANSIHFSYDLDADGTVEDNEDITFFHEDQKLKRRIRAGNRITIIENVTDLTFTYFDENNQPADHHEDIKTVAISMTVTAPAGRKQSLSRTYSTRVICRNLGL